MNKPLICYLMIGAGLSLFIAGIYLLHPVKFSLIIKGNMISLVFLVLMILGVWYLGGIRGLGYALGKSGAITSRYLPPIILIIPIIALGGALVGYLDTSLREAVQGPWGHLWLYLASVFAPGASALSGMIGELSSQGGIMSYRMGVLFTLLPITSIGVFMFRAMGIESGYANKMFGISLCVGAAISLTASLIEACYKRFQGEV